MATNDPRYIIYGLIDPNTKELRYVGRSSAGFNRPRHHLMPSTLQKEKGHRSSWIKSLQGKRPEIVAIQTFDSPMCLNEAEVYWISYFRSVGCRLTNHTDGGEGIVGFKHSDLTRQKMSRSRMGHPTSQDTRDKLALIFKDRVFTKEHRIAISKTLGMGQIVDQNGVIYDSCRDAARKLGISSGCIQRVVNGQRAQTGGMVFWRLNENA